MSKNRRTKRKTNRPIQPKSAPKPATEIETTPERGKLLDKLMSRIKKIGNFGKMQAIQNPPGEEKMSEVLQAFIHPHTRFATDTPSYERLVATALVAWNAALLSQAERAELLEKISENFDPETREDFYAVVGDLIKRKEKYFAQYRRHIIDAQVSDLGDSYHLTVVSLMKLRAE